MKRLGQNGALEIKEHPFFGELDWDDVLNKKTFPPVRKRKVMKHKDISIEEFLDPDHLNVLQKEKLKMKNWSFV